MEKEKFRDYGDASQEDAHVIPTKWNALERIWLKDGMTRLRQIKKGTAIKQLALIGYAKVVSENKLLEIALENHRKNERLQLGDIEKAIEQSFSKVGKLQQK